MASKTPRAEQNADKKPAEEPRKIGYVSDKLPSVMDRTAQVCLNDEVIFTDWACI